MNNLSFFIALFLLFGSTLFAQVGINTDNSNPHPSAGLDVKFNNKGLLPPRLSKVELNAIANPADGLLVYCTDCGSNGLGSLSMFMAGAWYTLSANCMNPLSPASGIHVPSPTLIEWHWNTVLNAVGYKWNIVNDETSAIDMGTSTSKIETGLTCLTSYTRYVWAYGACGLSMGTILSQTTSGGAINSPAPGTHIPSLTQIVWKWNAVAGATGYKWSATNDFATATDMGLSFMIMETGLTCNTNFIRYVWAYSNCGNSAITTLTQATLSTAINAPSAGTHFSGPTQIVWNWNTVSGATGYKWSTVNDYATATDMGIGLTKTESGLTCLTPYTRFVWSNNACGTSSATTLAQSTSGSTVTAPVAGTHVPSPTQIVWTWNPVSGATGYKWSMTNNYGTATDLGANLTNTETGLICLTPYSRYIWAYNACGNSTATTIAQTTTGTNTAAPTSGTHVSAPTEIVWNWNVVSGATGYKWSTTNDFATATDMGTLITKTETGLFCNTPYTRYAWAYNACGNSTATTLTQTTSLNPPATPTTGTHVPGITQIVWNWNTVSGATGYKWSITNDYATATDMGTAITKTETGLTCNTPYTRYAWAYSACGNSTPVTLTQTTSLNPPVTPITGTHVPSPTQIVWNWNSVSGATGYKWGTTNVYGSASDMGTATTKTETSLACNTSYTRYAWAYSACGNSTPVTLTQTTSILPASPITGTHVPGATQVVWNWNAVSGASGYKWNVTPDYGTASDMGTSTTKTETGLICITAYTRYVWAYNTCGNSTYTTLTATTSTNPPASPTTGTHVPNPIQIVWNWNASVGATGYRWSATNNFATATDMGSNMTKTETGLSCGTSYTRYVWAYGACGNSTSTTLIQSTLITVSSPFEGTHVASGNQIVWKWNTVTGATGYKWNNINDYATATDMGAATSKTETGLTQGTTYSRFVWAYNSCGISIAITISQTTLGIGQSYGGGIIFYIDGTGQHGLIAATSNQSNNAQWGCIGTSIPGTSTAIGTGQANTTAIINGCSTASIAAHLCDDLVLNGYSDWFLPSKDELHQMYLQKSVIPGLTNSPIYWSSSQYSSTEAWYHDYFFGELGYYGKDNGYGVRAVRDF